MTAARRRPTFAEVVRAFDTQTPLPTLAGTMFAFMDGSGDDGLCEHLPNDWHTFALVFSSADLLLSHNLSSSFILPHQPFYKWTGNPVVGRSRLSNAGRAKYRHNFAVSLAEQATVPVWIHVWSYRGRHLWPQKVATYEEMGFPPHHPPHRHGWMNFHCDRWRTMTALHGSKGNLIGRFAEGNLLVLFEICRHIDMLFKTACYALRAEGTPQGFIVITDPLCGDPIRGARKHGDLLSNLMNARMPNRCNLRTVEIQNSRVGELLADNVAGLFNDAIMHPGPTRQWDRAVRLFNGQKVHVNWFVYQDGGNGPELITRAAINGKAPGIPGGSAGEGHRGQVSARHASNASDPQC